MPTNLSKAFKERLISFFENNPPLSFSIFLRNMVLEYIREHMRLGFPLDFPGHLSSLEDLFELLDIAGEETVQQRRIQSSQQREVDKKATKTFTSKQESG